LTAALLLGGCDSGDPEGPGSLSILLTDAPGDVEQAIVTIDRIEIVGGSGGPRVLRDTPWTGDLALLTNEFVTLVDDYVLPQGSYAQLRFVISEAASRWRPTGGRTRCTPPPERISYVRGRLLAISRCRASRRPVSR
jgi:hypothetical protein